MTATPRTHLLSNGSYAVMLTAAGSGYSRWRDIAVTRWREDRHARLLGHLHLSSRCSRQAKCGPRAISRAASNPIPTKPSFYEDRAEFVRRDRSLTTTLEVVVSSEDDAEMRRVSITNSGRARAGYSIHFLRRALPRLPGGRRGPSGFLQPVCGDRICP